MQKELQKYKFERGKATIQNLTTFLGEKANFENN